ncbi:hypothetical protein NEIELOOT_03001 [Neisseria elongata subsp. glycolytica ATCC 29315]|uniref:Uncharacterized protein n=1 Tax=Neisseria elongata subsp. glycolytica ATCC 29315 TaxID=546263 RepID=D4DV85_NEIEG|nr:hypothetical protein NEIELOOT_03001 [Neisseria elongata subsp. glycolytica ATCC 29315]
MNLLYYVKGRLKNTVSPQVSDGLISYCRNVSSICRPKVNPPAFFRCRRIPAT